MNWNTPPDEKPEEKDPASRPLSLRERSASLALAVKREPTAVYLSIFSLFLAVGVWIGFASQADRPARLPVEASPAPLTGQHSILIIGVDRLPETSGIYAPRLVSLWLAGFFGQAQRINFAPLYPPAQAALPEASSLGADFRLNPDGTPGEAFLNRLRRLGVWWSGYVIVDEAALTAAIDLLGGVSLNGRQLDGQSALDSIPAPWKNSSAALQGQTDLLGALCSQASQLPDTAALAPVLALTGQHVRADFEIGSFADRQGFECQFPLTANVQP